MTPATHSTLFPHGTGSSPYSAPPSGADAVLEGLDPEQREVATALRGPVCVLAGAGTGKTRAITHRIAYGVRAGILQPSTVLAVTFTNRAAGEMRGRLRQLGAAGVQARTFHSAALRQLQYFWPKAVGGSMPRIVDRKIKLIADAAAACRLRLDRGELRDATAEIEWAKVTQTVPTDYAAAAAKAGRASPATPPRSPSSTPSTKTSSGTAPSSTSKTSSCSPSPSSRTGTTSPSRSAPSTSTSSSTNTRTSAPSNSDSWNCGSASATTSASSATPARPSTPSPEQPPTTYSTSAPATPEPPSSSSSATTAPHPKSSTSPTGSSPKPAAAPPTTAWFLISQRPAGPEPGYTEYTDEPAEAEGAARRISELMTTGIPASEIAILFRTNSQSETYEQALADAGIPYQLRGAERFFDRPEVRKAGVALRGAARFGGNDSLLDDAVDLPSQVRAVLSGEGWTPQPPAGSGAVRERWESLAALVNLAHDFTAAKPQATLGDLVAELDERANAQHAPTVQGVTLASLHSAKGLEWDVVFLVGVAEGMMPITYAKTDEQIEEERRLLYVGVTRAREHLHVSWSLTRSPGGRPNRRPSRFLHGLRPGSTATAGRTAAGGPGGVERGFTSTPDAVPRRTQRTPARCRVCGRTLTDAGEMKLMRCEDCPSDMDEGLYERLREWRADQAQRSGQPAFCVFTDKTLMAIAEAVPDDDGELARIPGVGVRKLNRYGADVLALCAGQEARKTTKATDSNSSKK